MAEQKSWQRPLRIRMSIWVFLATLSFGLGTLRDFEWIPPSFTGVCLRLELAFLLAALAAMVYTFFWATRNM
ncbi:MAG TPA: hypothetical protein PLC40_20000 [Candidatus Hydrogenedentes bacterium]|nr:hypothetical protein [Candidatus Hydrogenedentota bacterium]